MCFEILGFDIILDKRLKPWLLEINHTPSFTTDTPLDYKIKFGVIKESLEIMNISVKNRKDFRAKQKAKFEERMFTRSIKRLSLDDKVALKAKAMQERLKHEDNVMRNYERIYPVRFG